MKRWGEFVFNKPYAGEIIEKINEVVLPKDYVAFMKNHNGGEGDIGETWLILYPMEELQKINPKKDTASTSMITFLVLNTGGVTIIPTTIISMRAMYGSVNPTEIIPTCIIATFCSSVSGLLLDYFIRRKNGDI